MARPIREGTRIRTFKRKQGNGDYYVFEREVEYDPETRRDKTLSLRLIGKIPKGSEVMVSTRHRTPPEKKSADGTTRYRLGMLSLLKWVGKESGIDEDLKSALPQLKYGQLAERIADIARFWVATGGDTLPNLETWQLKHGIVGDKMLSEDICREVFNALGSNEEAIQCYFRARADRMGVKGGAVAFDTTTVSTYSENQQQARYGFNKDGDGLPTIKTLSLYSMATRQPFAFYNQPGNIPDVLSVTNALKQLDYLDLEMPLVVADNGFYSNQNIQEFFDAHVKFLIRVRPDDAKWINEAVLKHLDDFDDPNNCLSSDTDTYGFVLTENPDFPSTCRYNTAKHKKGERITTTHRVYLLLFRNRLLKTQAESEFDRALQELKADLENGVELNEAAQRRADKYLICKTVKGGKLKVSFNKEAIHEAKRLCGIFGAVSNQVKDAEEGLALYRKRENIEDMFELFKQKADGKKPRVWDSDRLRGREFVQFVALAYYDFLYAKLKALKATLGKPTGDKKHDTETVLKEERALLKWLKARSLHEVLGWFDAVEITRLTGKGHPAIKIITEHTRRDQLFLERLGYQGEMSPKNAA